MYEISARLSGLWDDYAHKLLCILKMTMVILLVSMSPLQASNVFGQRINYVQKQVSLEQIFKEIKKQTRYNIVWFEDNLNSKATQDINFKNAAIEEVMDRILSNQSASYEINNKTIVIKSKAPSAGEKLKKAILNFFEPLIDVTGRVVDESGEPLPGAKVKVNGAKNISTSTNANGKFTLKGIADNATITISSIGYESKELVVTANMGAIKLTQSDAKLEEVEINAGYYTVKDKERTGSISRVTAETISKQPINNPLQVLQGNVAGVEIVQATGLPGGGFTVRIRGRNSILNGNDPLYVVNGVPLSSSSLTSSFNNITPNSSPLSSINPLDIESIEVLKDADATAIYGSRGANGVILITTKKGHQGKIQAEANLSQGFGQVSRKLQLLNTTDYINMRTEAFANGKLTPQSTDYDVNGTWDQSKYTDWQKEIIGGIASQSTVRFSLSGGNENTTFMQSGTYYRESTVYPGDKKYGKKSALLSVNHVSANQKLNLFTSINYNIEDSTLPSADLTSSIFLPPNAPDALDQNGDLNWENGTYSSNPLAFLKSQYKCNVATLVGNVGLNYLIIPNVTFTIRGGYVRMNRDELTYAPLTAFNPKQGLKAGNRSAFYGDNWSQNINIEPQLSWNGHFGIGKLTLMFGGTIQDNKLHTQTINGTGYVSDGLMENAAAAATIRLSNVLNSDYRYLSTYGRVNYNIQDKYYFNVTSRRDGSSRFGSENLYANFGAIGTAWVFSNEEFIRKNVPFLTFGKIRASYGSTGNDQIGDYNYLELWSPTSQTYQGGNALYPSRLQNPNYAWEINKKAEAALELGVFNEGLHLTIAYYKNRSSNQLVNYAIAPSSGFSSILANLPATVQNTGWEFDVTSNIYNKGNFKWITSFNLSIPKNKLISFPSLQISAYKNQYVIGQPLNISKLLKFNGIDPTTGFYTFVDFDNSGTITNPGDRQVIKYLGQKFSGGIKNSFSYKNWDFDFLLQFVKQTGKNYRAYTAIPGSMSNQPIDVLSRWQKPSDITNIQKFSTTTNTSYSSGRTAGDYTISDASFIRLKNIALSYRFNNVILEKIGVKTGRLYLYGQNLFTVTNYLGLDPESQNLNILPPLRQLAIGIQITF